MMRLIVVGWLLAAASCATPARLPMEPGPQEGPWIAAIRPRKAGDGALLKITGRGFLRPGMQTWIWFPPGVWIEKDDFERVADGEIILRVPPDSATGPVSVRVGPNRSNAHEFEHVLPYSNPVPADAVAKDEKGFAILALSDLMVQMEPFYGFDEVGAIATRHHATLEGYLPYLNSYTLRFKTTKLQELLEIEKRVQAEPGVESVTLKVGLAPR